MTQRTSRDDAKTVACPRCGAWAGYACFGKGGRVSRRKSCHQQRHDAAILAGAEVVTPATVR